LRRSDGTCRPDLWKGSNKQMHMASLRFRRILLLFFLALCPQFSWAQTAEQFHRTGIVYFQRGQFNQALAAFSKVIQMDSTNARAYTSRGLARYKLGDINGALADHNKAIELDPRLGEAYTNRGGVRLSQGDKDGALADHSKSIELNPKNVEAYSNRGLVRLAKGNTDGAIQDFDKALELDPYYPRGARSYTNRATARLQKASTLKGQAAVNELRLAIKDSSTALIIDPKLAEAYNIRGLTWMKTIELSPKQGINLGIHNKALADFENAIRINPRLALSYLNRGILRVRLRKFTEAFEGLRTAVKLAPRLKSSATPWIQWAKSQLARVAQDKDG
jgi:tetratricopeptide (TPR) repeat protein